MRATRWFGRGALALVGLGAGLALAEAIVRLSGVAEDTAVIKSGRFRPSEIPGLVYEPVPDLAYDGSNLFLYHFRDRSNALGLRDRDHPPEKPAGVVRILVLGDSITMGLRIERPEDVFTAVLERELDAAGHAIEVLNFGVSGYNTPQEVALLLHRGRAFDPDLVVVQYCLNDVTHMDGGIAERVREADERGLDVNALEAWLSHSALYRYLRYVVLAPKQPMPAADDPLAGDRVQESFAELAAAADDDGFEVLVLVFPVFNAGLVSLPGHHAQVAAWAEEAGFDLLDLHEAFRACAASGEVAYDTLHPTELGHACAARALRDHLLEGDLLGAGR